MPVAAADILARAASELLRRDRTDLACACAGLALEEAPGDGRASELLAAALERQGRWEEALAHWRAAARDPPGRPQAAVNLALALLLHGRPGEAWPLFHGRIDLPGWISAATRASLSARRDARLRPGEPLEGRRVLVLTEQGLGDNLFAARWLAALSARRARIVLASTPALAPLLGRLPVLEGCLAPPDGRATTGLNMTGLEFDRWVPMLDLPGILGVEVPDAPEAPYLAPDPIRTAAWRERFAARGRPGRRRVGLVWSANPASLSAGRRSLDPEALASLAGIHGVDWISFQHDAPPGTLAGILPGVVDEVRGQPLDEYAAALSATDLLLTVDTMAAHLAGALGHPAWAMVTTGAGWYWGLEGGRCPWYGTLRLFRRPPSAPGWTEVTRDVARQLSSWAWP